MREQRKITLRELASESNISAPYLLDLENNRRGARPETLARIAEALGVTVKELTEEQKAG